MASGNAARLQPAHGRAENALPNEHRQNLVHERRRRKYRSSRSHQREIIIPRCIRVAYEIYYVFTRCENQLHGRAATLAICKGTVRVSRFARTPDRGQPRHARVQRDRERGVEAHTRHGEPPCASYGSTTAHMPIVCVEKATCRYRRMPRRRNQDLVLGLHDAGCLRVRSSIRTLALALACLLRAASLFSYGLDED